MYEDKKSTGTYGVRICYDEQKQKISAENVYIKTEKEGKN
jgi:hypothetical protein